MSSFLEAVAPGIDPPKSKHAIYGASKAEEHEIVKSEIFFSSFIKCSSSCHHDAIVAINVNVVLLY